MSRKAANKQKKLNSDIKGKTKKICLKQKISKMNKKWILITINIIVIVGIVIFMRESYAYLYQTIRGEKTYSLKVKGFSLKLDDSTTSENIKVENSEPVSDEIGKNTKAYTFSITNEDSSETGYVLYLDDVEIDNEINRMKDTVVKYQLIENGNEKVGLVSELGANPFRILTNGIINANATSTYSLRFWIKEDAEIPTGQIFNVKIRIIATSKEAIEEGKLVFGNTVITSEDGITQMTSEELQRYIDKANENKIETSLKDMIKQEMLNEIHPIGSVYISENNINPSETLGGTWDLVDKEFTPLFKSIKTLNFITVNNTNATIDDGYIVRSGHTIQLRLNFKNKVTLNDNIVTLGVVNLTAIGLSELPVAHYLSTVGTDNGNAVLIMNLAPDGNIDVADVVGRSGGSVGSNNTFYPLFTINAITEKMLDSECNKFYWKRTA